MVCSVHSENEAEHGAAFPDLEHHTAAVAVQQRRVLGIDLVIVTVRLHADQRGGLREMPVEHFRHFMSRVHEAESRGDDPRRRHHREQ